MHQALSPPWVHVSWDGGPRPPKAGTSTVRSVDHHFGPRHVMMRASRVDCHKGQR